MTDRPEQIIAKVAGLHDALANSHPALQRGLVRCRHCQRESAVSSAHCFKHGWPTCCGETMRLVTDEAKAPQ